MLLQCLCLGLDCKEAFSKLGIVIGETVLGQDMVRGSVNKLSRVRDANHNVLVKDVSRSQSIRDANNSKAREGWLLLTKAYIRNASCEKGNKTGFG